MKKPLQYYIHDAHDSLRFELAGSLSGADAEDVCQAWRTSLSITGNRTLIFDITFVAEADDRGCAVLDAWHRSGARIIAESPESQALVRAVLGEAVLRESVPLTRSKPSWLQRLRVILLGCPTVVDRSAVRWLRSNSLTSRSECRR